MPIDRVYLVGAGGHSIVVLDALRKGRDQLEIRVLDESVGRAGRKVLGVLVEQLDPDVALSGERFHICIGDNGARARLFERLMNAGGNPGTVIHPAATIAADAVIGGGSFVAAGAVVAPVVSVGCGVILNHGAIVDHECVVGDYCHLAPGVTLAGNVKVGFGVLIGAGANILPGIRIGDAAIIGAGAVVTADVPPRTTYVGVPARRIR